MPAKKPSSQEIEASEPAIAAQNISARFPIVGIGASAGGLEAATIFFKELSPHLGMAYVLVLHLDPARESKVSEILARTTALPVLQAKDGMRVAPDHVYVIPPNCEMTIEHWVLHLRDRDPHRSANTTIDTFLRSLAVAHGSDAIGVILSGTASDGTLGLEAIKGEAGITFAQEPTSAKYDGMPASAIASGCVDFILTPAGIAKEIARIRHHPYIADRLNPEAQPVGDDSDMEQIFRLLRRTTTVDFSGYKSPTIGRRIQRRMALQKIEATEGLWQPSASRPRRSGRPVSGSTDQCDQLLSQSRSIRSAQAGGLSAHSAGANLRLRTDPHLGSGMLDRRRDLLACHLHRRISGRRTSRYSHPGLWHGLERERDPTRQGRQFIRKISRRM